MCPLTERMYISHDEAEKIRNETKTKVNKLEIEADEDGSSSALSWLHQESTNSISKVCQYFNMHGFVHIPNFVSQEEAHEMIRQMKELCETQWDPTDGAESFGTDPDSNAKQGSRDYFLDSASRVHYFAEPTALRQDGSLKPEYQHDKLAALNKSGHALHNLAGSAFAKYTHSEKIQTLIQSLGWKDPVVPQSMYICKNPQIGGEVGSHQDSTFLFTTPKQSCLGLWLALDDATLENGCLWVRPKSHWEPVRRQFIRNPKYFESNDDGQQDEPKMTFLQLHPDTAAPWDGSLPKGSEPPCRGLLDHGFIPIECKAGDLLCFAGQLDHLSLPNVSEKPRHTFQLHLIEGPREGITWSPMNWLQYPNGKSFCRIGEMPK